MINKQNLWFLTLFSLIMVLSIYYLTMSDDALSTLNVSKSNNDNGTEVVISENETLVALRVADEEVHATTQTIVEKREVKTEVPVVDLLPRKRFRNECWEAGGIGSYSVLYPPTVRHAKTDYSVGLIPVVGVLVAEHTPGSTELELVHDSGVIFPEFLIGDVPACGE